MVSCVRTKAPALYIKPIIREMLNQQMILKTLAYWDKPFSDPNAFFLPNLLWEKMCIGNQDNDHILVFSIVGVFVRLKVPGLHISIYMVKIFLFTIQNKIGELEILRIEKNQFKLFLLCVVYIHNGDHITVPPHCHPYCSYFTLLGSLL